MQEKGEGAAGSRGGGRGHQMLRLQKLWSAEKLMEDTTVELSAREEVTHSQL